MSMTKKEREVYNYISELEKWCVLCGSPYNLHRHHIRYRSEFINSEAATYIGNVIILCMRCHQMVHSNKKYWQPRLIEIDKRIRGEIDV